MRTLTTTSDPVHKFFKLDDFFDLHHDLHKCCLQELHDNPELGFYEFETAKIVRRILKEYCSSFEVSDENLFPTVPTAILAVFNPKNSATLKPILLRGDTDALAMAGPSDMEQSMGTRKPAKRPAQSSITSLRGKPQTIQAPRIHQIATTDVVMMATLL